MDLKELFKDLVDENGEVPISALPEATAKMQSRLKLSGKQVDPSVVYKVQQEHQAYVIQSLWFQLVELKGEMLQIMDAVLALAGDEGEPTDYDPEADFQGMMAALEFDKMKRLYLAVMS